MYVYIYDELPRGKTEKQLLARRLAEPREPVSSRREIDNQRVYVCQERCLLLCVVPRPGGLSAMARRQHHAWYHVVGETQNLFSEENGTAFLSLQGGHINTNKKRKRIQVLFFTLHHQHTHTHSEREIERRSIIIEAALAPCRLSWPVERVGHRSSGVPEWYGGGEELWNTFWSYSGEVERFWHPVWDYCSRVIGDKTPGLGLDNF